MTEKLAIEFMTDLFSIIKAKKRDIAEIEKIIRIDFEKNVIFFFKDKGYDFQLVDNKYDPINRYCLNRTCESFKHIKYVNSAGHTIPESLVSSPEYGFKQNDTVVVSYHLPKFKIVPWEFAVKFEWWKTGNQNPSTAIWHPEEMSLETFYNKKLKRTFKLL